MNTNSLNSINREKTAPSKQNANVTDISVTGGEAKCPNEMKTTASNRAETTAITKQHPSLSTTKPLKQRTIDPSTFLLEAISDEAERKLISDIIAQFQNDPTTRRLDLNGKSISNKGATALVSLLAEINSLWYLNLSDNPIGNEGAQILANLLAENIMLQKLCLERTQIGNEGFLTLSQALQRNHTLVSLSILPISSNQENVNTEIIDQINLSVDKNNEIDIALNRMKTELCIAQTTNCLKQGKKLCDSSFLCDVIQLLTNNLWKLSYEIDCLRHNQSSHDPKKPTVLTYFLSKRTEIIDFSKQLVQVLHTLLTNQYEKANLSKKHGEKLVKNIENCMQALKNQLLTAFEGNIGCIASQYAKGHYGNGPRSFSDIGKVQCVHEILKMWEASFGEKSCPTWLATSSQELTTLNNFLSVLKGEDAPSPTPSTQVLFTSLSILIEQLTTKQSTDTSSPEKKKQKQEMHGVLSPGKS